MIHILMARTLPELLVQLATMEKALQELIGMFHWYLCKRLMKTIYSKVQM